MRKFISVCIMVLFALSTVFVCSASAHEKTYASDKIFAISKGGDTREFPQYSEEAIEECIKLGFDAVSVETGEEGVSYERLSEILVFTEDRIVVIIDCTEENMEKIFSIADGYKNVYLRVRDINAKDLTTWAKAKSNKIKVIPSYNGNIIFSAISVYNSAKENSYELCEFTSKNRYGVIFSEFFTNRFENTKGLSPVYNNDFSGQRNDSLHGWESLLSLGYSAIETENAKEFSDYIALLNESYLRLEKLYNEVKDTDLTQYTSNSTSDFEKALKNADEILNSDKAVSQLEIDECIKALSSSMDEFEENEGGESKTISVTPMKIFWIAFAITLFLSSQIYLHRKTKKTN